MTNIAFGRSFQLYPSNFCRAFEEKIKIMEIE